MDDSALTGHVPHPIKLISCVTGNTPEMRAHWIIQESEVQNTEWRTEKAKNDLLNGRAHIYVSAHARTAFAKKA